MTIFRLPAFGLAAAETGVLLTLAMSPLSVAQSELARQTAGTRAISPVAASVAGGGERPDGVLAIQPGGLRSAAGATQPAGLKDSSSCVKRALRTPPLE